MSRSLRFFAVLFAAALVSIDISAQRMPGRDRGEGLRDGMRRDCEPRGAAAAAGSAHEPYAALERELPSLKVDLALTREQVDGWSLFERDVRQLAEVDRARVRQLLSLRDATREPPGALAFVGSLADFDQRKSEATVDLRRHLESLYASLDDKQKRMLDRRVVLSQSEPLGMPAPGGRRG